MPKSNANLALKGLDEMVSTEESRQEQKREQVQQIPIDALHSGVSGTAQRGAYGRRQEPELHLPGLKRPQ